MGIPSSILRRVHGPPRKESKLHTEIEGEHEARKGMHNGTQYYLILQEALSVLSLTRRYSDEALTCFSMCLPLCAAVSCESQKHISEVFQFFVHNL